MSLAGSDTLIPPRRQRWAGVAGSGEVRLACRVRLPDGRVFSGSLPAQKHRALQIGMLHGDSDGLVELTPGTRPPGGKVEIDRRRSACHYLPGGAGDPSGQWLAQLLEHAERIVAGDYARRRFKDGPREEAFVGVAPRTRPEGGRHAVAHSTWLWVDVDKPGELPALWGLLAERPAQVLIASAGSGGVHAYWRLDRPLPAVMPDERTGELVDWIERANLRLIHRLGSGPDGEPTVADRQCAGPARLLRLAGTRNWKTGLYARVVQADLALPSYPVAELVGDLPDPDPHPPARRRPNAHLRGARDPYRRIAPPEYFARLAGVPVSRHAAVLCPSPRHREQNASCRVWPEPERGWWCFGCGAGGAIYDLASLVLGGPTGHALATDADAFRAAKRLVVERFAEIR